MQAPDAREIPELSPEFGMSPRRPPPLVLRIPPPGATWKPVRIAVIVAVTLAAIAATALLFSVILRQESYFVRHWLPVIAMMSAILVIYPLVFAFVWSLRNLFVVRERTKFAEKFPDVAADPLAQKVSNHWTHNNRRSPLNELRTILEASLPASRRGAVIVVIGDIETPASPGDVVFDPVIITPTQYLGRRLIVIWIAAALFAYWLIARFKLLPIPQFNLRGLGGLFAFAGVMMVRWFWQSAVRPTYFRLAPGVIQKFTYLLRGQAPKVQSFPMAAGTMIVLHYLKRQRWGRLRAVISDGTRHCVLTIGLIRNRKQVATDFWNSVLSTAPTPQLSQTELVG